jgi:putative spermidine/putrescine transport system ATP-binding protein
MDPEGGYYLQLIDLAKSYGSHRVVDGFSISIRKGEFVSILGPSGCGKTTTLRMIAGFIEPDAGQIRLGGANIENVPTHQRGAAMVFQNYALFPHMTVFENVAFGLRMQKVGGADIKRRVAETLALVRLPDLGDRYPKQLSGGQQQRVALARAVVLNPKVLLLDEPLSNLDAKLRKELRSEFLEIHKLSGITTLFVTHDLEEAFALSDRVAVMNRGRLEQFGTPLEIYHQPQSGFIADFMGHTNILDGQLKHDEQDGDVFVCGSLVIRVGMAPGAAPQAARIAIPGHLLQVSTERNDADNDFAARVLRVSFLGARLQMRLSVDDHVLNAELPATKALHGLREGMTVRVGWDRGDAVSVPADGAVLA